MVLMKKKVIIVIVLVVCIILYYGFIKYCQSNSTAEYFYDSNGHYESIKFNNNIYEAISFVPDPYELVVKENSTGGNTYYIAHNNYNDFFLPWDSLVFYSDDYDYKGAFIRVFPYDNLYLMNGFVYPTMHKNEVNEIWLSLSSSYEIINDIETVDKIVSCAKSNGEKELDKEVYDYIVANSWDNHCIYLKYEGYPLVEEFFVTETEDGRYIVDQYTAEEYDTVYYDEH